ncbi:MAG: hypothetical protein R3E76_00625 [Planctomycetota bacterium]
MSEHSLDRIEEAVGEAEKLTSCEYIVVLAPASSRYQGRIFAAGGLAAVLVYLSLYAMNLWGAEIGIDPLWLLIEAATIGGLLAYLLTRLNPLRRMLIPKWAMTAAVDTAAHATFSVENVSLTKDRNAILIYVSVLEGEMRLMPDIGVQQRVSEGNLGKIRAKLANTDNEDPATLICNAIRELGECCKECFPIQEDDENELPDRPQIRLP